MSWPAAAPGFPAEVTGLAWLLAVRSGGVLYRWSSRDLQLIDADGEDLDCAGGAAVDAVEESLEAPGSITAAVPATTAQAQVLLTNLDRSRVEVSLVPIRGGVALEADRVIVREGRLTQLEVLLDGLVAITVDPFDAADDEDWTGAPTIDPRAWPLAPDAVIGRRAPVVYGRPGAWEYSEVQGTVTTPSLAYTEQGWQSTVTWTPARAERTAGVTPLLPVSREEVDIDVPHPDGGTFLVEALARVDLLVLSWLPVAAEHVAVWFRVPGTDQATAVELPVVTAYDGLGRPWAAVDLSGEEPTVRDAGQWWAAFTPTYLAGWEPNPGGWVAAPSGAIGELVRAVLRRSSALIDHAAVEQAAPILDDLGRIGGYVDAQISALDWVRSRLEPLGWVLAMRSGLAPVARWPDSAVATLSLDAGDWCQAGPWRFVGAVARAVRVEWAKAEIGSQVASMIAYDAAVPDAALWRLRQEDVVEAPEVWDAATAQSVATAALRDRAAVVEVEVHLDAHRWGWLRAGHGVQLEGGLVEGLFVVASVTQDDSGERSAVLRQVPDIAVRS